MAGLDLDPRIVLHTSAGVVVLHIKPDSAEQGTVAFPMLGNVPYSVIYDFPVSTVILDVPLYGPVAMPVNLTAMGSTGDSSIELPVLGTTPYEIVLGPPNIPAEAMWSGAGLVTAALGGTTGLILIGAAVLVLLAMRRR